MVATARRREAGRVGYSFMVVAEDGLGSELRARLAALLSANLDEGERYRERAWRTLRPAFRVVALARGEPVGQGSGFWVPCRPALRLLGLGDVAASSSPPSRKASAVAPSSSACAPYSPSVVSVTPST
jgi:hypothetical protein